MKKSSVGLPKKASDCIELYKEKEKKIQRQETTLLHSLWTYNNSSARLQSAKLALTVILPFPSVTLSSQKNLEWVESVDLSLGKSDANI